MRIPTLPANLSGPVAGPGRDVSPAPRPADPNDIVVRHDAASLFALAAFALYVAVSLAGPGGRLLAVTFPLGCVLVALLTYARSPATFLAFVWWAWLLTPFLRRVFDLRFGFHPTNSMLLGPLLATSVAGFTVLRRWRMLRSSSYVSFLVAGGALAYAFLIGVVRQSATSASYDLLTWAAPLLFGLHLALEWRQFPVVRVTLSSCVLLGLIVTALYGIFQFVNPPLWDRTWVLSAEMYSVGAPLPFLIRVFSTLNAPGPFSIMLVFSLLFGLATPTRWRTFALAVGLAALILTKGRSAWGAFLLGALVMQLRQPLRSLPRQWVALLGVILLASPIITQPRVMSVFTRRAATLTNVGQDDSFQTRVNFTRSALAAMSTSPAGSGLGQLGGASKLLSGTKVGSAFDSGPLEIFGVMGWLGGMLFTMSLLAIILPIFRTRRTKFEPVTSAAASVVLALLFASLFGNIFNGVSGFFYWSAVGIASAGRTHAQAVELVRRYANFPGKASVAPPAQRTSAA